ncbi:hypothetical protein B0H66DRAFT_566733 [Apodospora peruviana]|uniref:Uncharacterized protein n=1 Tax=Apodospora peruviana TaxID=516989 RepID=A0AAE0HVI9_9PEZI|nr:hypothetical protein B0H66DRAFT_571307 [Apodospora peruviana]KAK3313690.1 hypothetical protein B0H66DRAFT_566733 [Apodospora peruviana]
MTPPWPLCRFLPFFCLCIASTYLILGEMLSNNLASRQFSKRVRQTVENEARKLYIHSHALPSFQEIFFYVMASERSFVDGMWCWSLHTIVIVMWETAAIHDETTYAGNPPW